MVAQASLGISRGVFTCTLEKQKKLDLRGARLTQMLSIVMQCLVGIHKLPGDLHGDFVVFGLAMWDFLLCHCIWDENYLPACTLEHFYLTRIEKGVAQELKKVAVVYCVELARSGPGLR